MRTPRLRGVRSISGIAARALPALLVAAAACAHAPAPRDLQPREVIGLDAVAIEAPPEPGWKVLDRGIGYRRSIVLRHEDANHWDRRISVYEHPLVAPPPTPADLLASLQRSANGARSSVTLSTIEASDRRGPFSATWTERSAEPGVAGADRLKLMRVQAFVPPLRLDRWYVVAYAERGEPERVEPQFEERARAALDAVRLTPASATPAGRFGDAPPRGSVYIQAQGGVAAFRLRGEDYMGAALVFGSGGAALRRGSASGLGFALDASLWAGEDETRSAAAVALSPRAFSVAGPLRVGGGVDVGMEARYDTVTDDRRYGFVVGPAAFAAIDLLHLRGSRTLYVQLDAGAATPRFFHGALAIGLRGHLAPL